MAANNITFIDELDVSKVEFTLKVRVVRLTKQLVTGSATRTYRIDMVLVDEKVFM